MRAMDLVNFANEGRKAGHPLLTYRQLDYWLRHRLFGRPGLGSGNNRDLDRDEVRHALVMAHLVEAGIAPPRATRIAQAGLNPLSTPPLPASPVSITVDLGRIPLPGEEFFGDPGK